jgi:hypothetical protein
LDNTVALKQLDLAHKVLSLSLSLVLLFQECESEVMAGHLFACDEQYGEWPHSAYCYPGRGPYDDVVGFEVDV